MPEELPQDAPLDADLLERLVATALTEDLGGNPGTDVTTLATITSTALVRGDIRAREAGVIAGLDVVAVTLRQVAERFALPTPTVALHVADGAVVAPGAILASVSGAGQAILVAERTILNVLSRASGIATHTRRWVDALAGTNARVLDTRKTTPGLRELEKYAVRCGGGVNKRHGLYDCAMVKDNHIVAAGSISAAIAAIGARSPDIPIQVEVESAAQAREAIAAGARFLMIDNMAPDAMAELVAEVRLREASVGTVWLEATGGLTLANARDVAATGVDFMSVGGLTHSSPILDIGLDFA